MTRLPPCQHRGSQRRAECCADKKLNRWICRLLKQKDGTTPMDCVETSRQSAENMRGAPSEHAKTWAERVAICEICPHYDAITPEMPS